MMEISDSEIVSFENPVDPLRIDMVLDKIFAYLHLDRHPTNALLNYRLVNHFWNEKILSILRKQGKIITLDCRNAGQYLKILKAANNNLVPGLKLRIRFDEDELATLDSTKLINCTAEVVNLFGSNCIQAIKVQPDTKISRSEDWAKFLKLLQNAAEGLEEIYVGNVQESNLVNLQVSALFQTEFRYPSEFPQLRSLYFGSPFANSSVAAMIINGSPLLQEVTIKPAIGHKSDELLPRLQLNFFNNLRKLTIAMYERSSYESLAQLILPNLTTFVLTIIMEVGTESGHYLQSFLSQNCPKLESLTFEFLFSSNFSKDFPNGLPEFLPALKHLGYYFVPSVKTIQESPHFLKLDNSSLEPTKFPALTSISTNLGVFLYMAQHRHNRPYGRWYNNTFYLNNLTFPTVQCLHLTLNIVNYMNYVDGSISMKDNINQLHLLYPNLTQVVINNQIAPSTTVTRYYKKGQSVKDILRVLLQEMNRITTLEITNYYEDWLSQILMEEPASEALVDSFRNLTHLRFTSIEKNYKWSCPRVNLTKILSSMSNLRVLQLKPEHLTTGCLQQGSKEALTKLKEFQWLFPHVRIEFA